MIKFVSRYAFCVSMEFIHAISVFYSKSNVFEIFKNRYCNKLCKRHELIFLLEFVETAVNIKWIEKVL